MTSFSPPPMPVMAAPEGMGVNLLVNIALICVILLCWGLSSERKRGPIMPLILMGTGLSAVLVEPVFDNTLLYWWPTENPYAMFTSYGRTIPWSAVIGYAWFFGGSAYVLWRLFDRGVTLSQALKYYGVLVLIDWGAVSLAEWTHQSTFYGNQPFRWLGSPLWFSFVDAAGGFVLGAAMHALVPHLGGARKALLLFLPTFIYGGVLGSTTPSVSQALNSGWSDTAVAVGGAVTIGLCCLLVFVVSKLVVAVSPGRQTTN